MLLHCHIIPFTTCLTAQVITYRVCPLLLQVGPVEIVDGLYLGDSIHSSQQSVLKETGITALINVSTGKNFFESEFEYMTIPVNDNDTADLSCWFQEAINFIGKYQARIQMGQGFRIHSVNYKKLGFLSNAGPDP